MLKKNTIKILNAEIIFNKNLNSVIPNIKVRRSMYEKEKENIISIITLKIEIPVNIKWINEQLNLLVIGIEIILTKNIKEKA